MNTKLKFILKGAFLGSLFFSFTVHAEDLEKGKRLYMSNCIQCHNRDPNLKGNLGPELVDSPLEIVYAKVMTGVYPEKLPVGFKPKRQSKVMRKIPHLQKDIPAIHAWIQSVKKKK